MYVTTGVPVLEGYRVQFSCSPQGFPSSQPFNFRSPSMVRFWVTPAQIRAFGIRGQELVAAGRPTCAMCGQPIDPEGHFCPRRNGHKK